MTERSYEEFPPSSEKSRPLGESLRRGLGAAGIVAAFGTAGYSGGLIATSAVPAEIIVGNAYQAEVSLSANPYDVSRIQLVTNGGPIDIAFDSPVPVAPGIKVTPMLSNGSLELNSEGGFRANSLIPSDEEVHQAITSAAEQLALRFGLGAAVAEALLLVGAGLYRHRSPNRQQVFSSVAAGAIALSTVAGQAAVHYQPDNYSTFSADGLLARVTDNRTLLTDLQARSEQMEPFITSLLVVSAELQQTFVNPESDGEVAAKFLLVSDIHGVNQYAMLKNIIDEQGITAVIDTGDLINFGYAEELSASQLDTGIASLGVPYMFVRGNHDSNSPDSHEFLERMSKIDNVILLQPDDTNYAEVTVNGVSIAGFNDPRYYGDSNTRNDEIESAAADRFNQSFADEPAPDIVITHSPLAATDIEQAGLTINGHMHKPDLSGRHIQVGSFTGGGLFHHLPDNEEGISSDQPYTFDILSIDSSCQPHSLSRFSFNSITEGQPQYDSVTYINGRQLGVTQEADRDCSTEQEVDIRTVPAQENLTTASSEQIEARPAVTPPPSNN